MQYFGLKYIEYWSQILLFSLDHFLFINNILKSHSFCVCITNKQKQKKVHHHHHQKKNKTALLCIIMYTTLDKIATGILRNIRVFRWNDYVAQLLLLFFSSKNRVCNWGSWNTQFVLDGTGTYSMLFQEIKNDFCFCNEKKYALSHQASNKKNMTAWQSLTLVFME